MDLGRLGAVVLAAGRSCRMGGEHKLLKPWRGKPLIQYALDRVCGLGLGYVALVTGERAEDVEAAAAEHSVVFVRNGHFASGVASSLSAGIAAMPGHIEGAFIAMGDMPLVPLEVYNELAAGFGARDIGVVMHGDSRGHPVLFGREHFGALTRLRGDKGAASVIMQNPDRVYEVLSRSAGVLLDFDTPDDFVNA